MAFCKVGILSLLLLSGIFLLGIEVEYGNAQKMCLQVCDPEVAYMTCPSSGDEKMSDVCVNCCTAAVGCKLFRSDGSFICTGTPE
ncbi:Proteinase inhibitor type-2 CEVI57 [Capsicum chinense]|uniref:proteinase inhibitor PSI-1.2-like n=1 Tax=Capsicum annuum TaxID=4072 RepID=UPI0007BEF89E|nr:proteinase inhibitor PSI-1.2-like [Capsicum annuum]PHU14688.1 Proteinase inhibitor type-2 CEVI57 [Capsicum chinense]